MKTPQSQLIQRQEIATELLGEIEWHGETGYCCCPGYDLHTNNTNSRACKVYLNGPPTIHCVHQSCGDVVAEANARLRAAVGKVEAGGHIFRLTPQERTEMQRREHEKAAKTASEVETQRKAAELLPQLLEHYKWQECDIRGGSPMRIEEEAREDWRLLLSLYQPDDVVWIGETWDSATPDDEEWKRHAASKHFRTVAQWQAGDTPKGPLICPATFKPGRYSRSDANVLQRRLVALDGDAVDPVTAAKLSRKEPLTEDDKRNNRNACGAVLNWLRRETDWKLRAIIDSGSKSLHGWFDCPDTNTLEAAKIVLRSLGFDPATLRPSQPVRLPGIFRHDAGRWQRLIFLSQTQPSFMP